MKILQINADRCRDAHDLLYQTALEKDMDICLVSEPNLNLSTDWSGHCDAKILIINTSLFIKTRGQGKGFTWFETEKYRIISGYCSPNRGEEELRTILEEISVYLRESGSKDVILGADFNGKSPQWGAPGTDKRGRILTEWIASENLCVLNCGGTPTFRRRNQESHIDITLCTQSLAERIKWEVLDEVETRSPHQYITIDIEENRRSESERRVTGGKGTWNLKTLNRETLKEFIQEKNTEEKIETVVRLTKVVTEACNKAMKKKHNGKRVRRAAYWWNEIIKEKRELCNKERRKYTRERKKSANGERCISLYKKYVGAKESLSEEIKGAKEKCWTELCQELENDIYGKAYKIVTKKISKPLPKIPPEVRKEIIGKLFPDHPIVRWTHNEAHNDEVPSFDMDELLEAMININTNKAPGPDQIPPLVVRETILTIPQTILDLMNTLLKRLIVPKEWKEARVALIPKTAKKPNEPVAYRPICLLNSFGKLYEKMILKRLLTEIDEKQLIDTNQYGFLPGKSTTQAINEVVKISMNEIKKKRWKRNLCILIALDIRNAFNSAPWIHIISSLEGLSPYLIEIFKSYLEERDIVGEEFEKHMTAGVPQGSVVGATLWNLLYDGVLRLDLPEGVRLVAYADDLAILVTARKEDLLEDKANLTLSRISEWMDGKMLELAPEKTEAIVLSGRKNCRPLNITLLGQRVEFRRTLKYLGVLLDGSLTFLPHLKYVADKADKKTANLSRIMPRTGGVGEKKRSVLGGIMESIILYAAPVWSSSLKHKTYREILLKEQRKSLLRITRAYRTVSTNALAVIGRTIPLDMKAEERGNCFGKTDREKQREREITISKWQERWEGSETGHWTRSLIREVKPWFTRKHGETNFHLTQILSGHGCFCEYLYRFKKLPSPDCTYCGENIPDTASHTVFSCSRWDQYRFELENRLQQRLTTDNMIPLMLTSRDNWRTISEYLVRIMKEKEEIERRTKETMVIVPTDLVQPEIPSDP